MYIYNIIILTCIFIFTEYTITMYDSKTREKRFVFRFFDCIDLENYFICLYTGELQVDLCKK